ncbi:MAG TPA: DUF4157 domain-containing protein [Blastocatellia bacterium]|nr:DUF4157 domain-containing protein [Blastocatellia bacterium]
MHDVLRSPGQPLDSDTRAFMEPRFGHDFSRVRVHTDPYAAQSAREVNALAYTVGRDVVFAAGQYSPKTTNGQHLLAHELMHVAQQGRIADQRLTKLEIGDARTPLEEEADRAAQDVMSGFNPVSMPSKAPPGLQRACPPTPTNIGATASATSCARRGPAIVVGDTLRFCKDSTELAATETGYLKSLTTDALKATRLEIHGNASSEGPGGDYNFNLACKRAAAIGGQFKAAGVSAPITLLTHGPTTLYGDAQSNRNVVVVMEKPPAPAGPTVKEQATALAEKDCAAITKLHKARQMDTVGLFLEIYSCLTCSFVDAFKTDVFEDPLWLANVNHRTFARLQQAFASPNADYQKVFAPCNVLDRCLSVDIGVFERIGCQGIVEGTGMLSYLKECTEGVGGIHLSVDLRDSLKDEKCSSAANKRDYARVVPFFQACNLSILSRTPVLGKQIAERVAIPRITEQRNAAWAAAGCP